MTYGLYIHIPFCEQKCYYCDFPSYAGMEPQYDAYVEALCQEIRHSAFAHQAVDTIYIGGGTPNVLPSSKLGHILTAITDTFSVAKDAEVTVEANPTKDSLSWYEEMLSYGVNRISFGVQTFSDEELRKIGRNHSAKEAMESVYHAYDRGFRNLSVDLIYALPNQTMEQIQQNVGQAFALPITHLSIYGLKVEEKTVFAHWQKKGQLSLPSEEVSEAMYDYICAKVKEKGWKHYEISNFAMAGYESRHNTKYWTYVPYLGFGAAAHSFTGKERWENTHQVARYITEVTGGGNPRTETIVIDKQRAMEDYCFLSLRRQMGIDTQDFYKRFQVPYDAMFGEETKKLLLQKLVEEKEGHVALTKEGIRYGNYVFSQFIK